MVDYNLLIGAHTKEQREGPGTCMGKSGATWTE